MELEILRLFLKEGCSKEKIAKLLKITVDDVVNYLNSQYYPCVGVTSKYAIKVKEATEYYLSSNEISATKAAKKYGLGPTNFCLNLKRFGIVAENRLNKVKFNENIFDSIDNEEKAYWLGFIFADGNISNQLPIGKKRYLFELSLSDKDHSHLDLFNNFMLHEKNNVKVGNVKINNKAFKRCRWCVNNKHLWNVLNNLGCTPCKSLTLKFPDESIFKEKSLIKHFIRGYFDGDGSVGIYRRGPLCSCLGTKDVLEYIEEHYGFDLGNYYHDKRHTKFTFSFLLNCEKAKEFLNYLYKDAKIYLLRKYEKYLEICRLYEKSNRLLESKNGESCDANPVLSIETKKSVPV